jgi:hypothetical protein
VPQQAASCCTQWRAGGGPCRGVGTAARGEGRLAPGATGQAGRQAGRQRYKRRAHRPGKAPAISRRQQEPAWPQPPIQSPPAAPRTST